MAHKAQIQFIQHVKKQLPHKFVGHNVIDVGSMDINGNNRRFFWFCNYIGIDIVHGKNVDEVGPAHEVINYLDHRLDPKLPTTIISTECLEHDQFWMFTLNEMYNHLQPGELLIITAAGEGREEHGTHEHHAWCSPGTNDYYKNITNEMFEGCLPPSKFSTYFVRQHQNDFQFYGIKK
jgi:hypothetical protein